MFRSFLSVVILAIGLQSIAQTNQDSMILIDSIRIFYLSDQFELTEEQKRLLSDFFNYQNTLELEFHIDSYTDVDGNDEYNKQLSLRRTEEIVFWLIDRGVNIERIFQSGHGEQFAKNVVYPTLKAQDRKSEIKVYQRTRYKLFEGTVISENLDSIQDLEISIFDNGVKRKIEIAKGFEFSIPIPVNREVELQFAIKDHFPLVKRLKLSSRSKASNVKLSLDKMNIGATASIHIQFVGGTSIVLPYFEGSLKTLASILKKSPNICLEFAGHIHQPGKIIIDKENKGYGLSIARSIEVHDYMLDAGISNGRLLARGYGNSQMKYQEPKNGEETSANRRVEAKVMNCDSTRVLKNDFVEDLDLYRQRDKMEELYHPLYLDEHLQGIHSHIKLQILKEVEYLKSKGVDPKIYPYRTLHNGYIKRVLKF